jgi:hypothetical protein
MNGMPEPPPQGMGYVVIGAREVYDAVLRLTTKVDTLTTQLGDVMGDHADHEKRLRALEKGRWPLPALGVLLSVAAVVVAASGKG